jgi:hypothetical protein
MIKIIDKIIGEAVKTPEQVPPGTVYVGSDDGVCWPGDGSVYLDDNAGVCFPGEITVEPN